MNPQFVQASPARKLWVLICCLPQRWKKQLSPTSTKSSHWSLSSLTLGGQVSSVSAFLAKITSSLSHCYLVFLVLWNFLWLSLLLSATYDSLFVLCSVGASRRCYLGVSDSHLLLSWSGSNWCNTMPTWVKPSVTDFTQVWVPSASTSPLHFRAALQLAMFEIPDSAGRFKFKKMTSVAASLGALSSHVETRDTSDTVSYN